MMTRLSLRVVEHLEGDGEAIFRHACALGLEGIVSKRRDARYRSGRSLPLRRGPRRSGELSATCLKLSSVANLGVNPCACCF